MKRLPIVDASSRALFAGIMVLAVYFLFSGHNNPGGGFVGGLTAGAAISLRYVAGGVAEVREVFRLPPWTILGSGLVVAAGTALVPVLTGNNVLEHASFDEDLPVFGHVAGTTALPFDIGVYLIVIGLVLMAYEAFGDELTDGDPGAEGPAGAGDDPARSASASDHLPGDDDMEARR